jgi:CBS domain-containing protein
MSTCETIESTGMGLREMVTITRLQSVTEAAEIMSHECVGSLVVVASRDDDTMVGIVTERDIMKWLGRVTAETYFEDVEQIMIRDVATCNAGTSLDEVRTIMKDNGIRHVPIIENGIAVGMLSARDVLGQ